MFLSLHHYTEAPVCAGCDDIKLGELGEITFGKAAASPSAAGLGAAAAVKAAGDNAGRAAGGADYAIHESSEAY